MTDEECLHLFTTFWNETGRIGERLEREGDHEAQAELNQICKAMTDVLKESLIPNAVSGLSIHIRTSSRTFCKIENGLLIHIGFSCG
jgi:hypothetical protein